MKYDTVKLFALGIEVGTQAGGELDRDAVAPSDPASSDRPAAWPSRVLARGRITRMMRLIAAVARLEHGLLLVRARVSAQRDSHGDEK